MFKDLPYTDEYNHQIPVKFLRPSSDDTLANIQPNASSNNNTSNISIETPLVFTEVATAYYTSSGEADIPEYLRPFIPVDGKVYSTDLNNNKKILLDVGSKEWLAELCRRRESANETNSRQVNSLGISDKKLGKTTPWNFPQKKNSHDRDTSTSLSQDTKKQKLDTFQQSSKRPIVPSDDNIRQVLPWLCIFTSKTPSTSFGLKRNGF
ncbi:hypothetical protein GLOIN_2v1780361 [Rhizophagus irregularis DAOM 181602=DAOM 197198]|nr:hypothetical protein GLOIN_2v1780361 [Rhizophagus irregularis DAOM 181602=DAOM 197198]